MCAMNTQENDLTQIVPSLFIFLVQIGHFYGVSDAFIYFHYDLYSDLNIDLSVIKL
jgi:hypothetical protein